MAAGSLHAGPRSRRLPVTTLLVLNPREHHIESPGWTNMEKNRKKVDTIHAWPQPWPMAPDQLQSLELGDARSDSPRDVAAGYRNSAYGAAEGDSPLAAGRGARGRTAERASTIRQAYFRNWVWCRGSGAWVWTGAERLNPLSSLPCCRVSRASTSIDPQCRPSLASSPAYRGPPCCPATAPATPSSVSPPGTCGGGDRGFASAPSKALAPRNSSPRMTQQSHRGEGREVGCVRSQYRPCPQGSAAHAGKLDAHAWPPGPLGGKPVTLPPPPLYATRVCLWAPGRTGEGLAPGAAIGC